jgi:hypothetical protein
MTDSLQMGLPFQNSSWEEAPAKTFRWLDAVGDWMERALDSSGNNAELLMNALPSGFSGKTSLALSPATQEQTSQKSSTDSLDTDQSFLTKDGSPEESASDQSEQPYGECLTLRLSESPSGAGESSLSQVLEPWGENLQEFCLSQKAATGILRRAAKRNRKLPTPLRDALELLASEQPPTSPSV